MEQIVVGRVNTPTEQSSWELRSRIKIAQATDLPESSELDKTIDMTTVSVRFEEMTASHRQVIGLNYSV